METDMKKAQVQIGKTYAAKVSGQICPVRLVAERIQGGWYGKNLRTGKAIIVKTAARLRWQVQSAPACQPEPAGIY